MFVPSLTLYRKAVRFGVPPDKLKLHGLPVRKVLLTKMARQEPGANKNTTKGMACVRCSVGICVCRL